MPQKREGESIAADHELGRRDQRLQHARRRRRQLTRGRHSDLEDDGRGDEKRGAQDARHARHSAHYSTITCPYIHGCGVQM